MCGLLVRGTWHDGSTVGWPTHCRRYFTSSTAKIVSIAESLQNRQAGADPGLEIGGPYGEHGVRAYNGGLGAVPPAGSRGRAPGQGGEAPLKLNTFMLSYA